MSSFPRRGQSSESGHDGDHARSVAKGGGAAEGRGRGPTRGADRLGSKRPARVGRAFAFYLSYSRPGGPRDLHRGALSLCRARAGPGRGGPRRARARCRPLPPGHRADRRELVPLDPERVPGPALRGPDQVQAGAWSGRLPRPGRSTSRCADGAALGERRGFPVVLIWCHGSPPARGRQAHTSAARLQIPFSHGPPSPMQGARQCRSDGPESESTADG